MGTLFVFTAACREGDVILPLTLQTETEAQSCLVILGGHTASGSVPAHLVGWEDQRQGNMQEAGWPGRKGCWMAGHWAKWHRPPLPFKVLSPHWKGRGGEPGSHPRVKG